MLRLRREQLGQATVLRLSGNLDMTTAPQLKDEVQALTASEVQTVVVDLEAIGIIDSSGVGVLVSLFKRLHEKQGYVCFAGVKGQPKEVFRLLRLDRSIDLFPSVTAALEKVGQR
jgi:anti-sigma B factor antagonist